MCSSDGISLIACQLALQLTMRRTAATLAIARAYARGDYAEAVKWYRKAVEQGNALGQSNLSFMYDKGRGVPENAAEAVKWYRKAEDLPAFLWLSFHSQWVLRPNPHRVFASRHGEGSP